MHMLREAGYKVSAGVVNILDSDWENAVELGEVVDEAPFSPIGDKAHQKNIEMIEKSDAVVLANLSVGRGNFMNLIAAMHASNLGKLVVVDRTPFRERNFVGKEAEELYMKILKRAAVVRKEEEVLDAVRRLLVDGRTLVVSGDFFGVSTGLLGGWKRVKHAFNHTVGDEFHSMDPAEYLRMVARSYGLSSYFGLLTSVPMDKLSVKSCGEVTVFVTAGVMNPNEKIGTINIIAVFECRMSRAAMLNAIITVTEAKTKALLESGHSFTGTNTDAVVVLCTQKGRYHRYCGPASDIGEKLWKCAGEAVKESLARW